MNYIGNKYKLLPQLLELFPNDCHTFLDLFAGGLDVAINYTADRIIANDINNHLIDIYKTFQKYSYDELIQSIWGRIEKYDLSKTNKQGFLAYRDYYNNSDRDPLDLYVLMNYSFNYQFRFNNNHEFNTPFGANKSSFNKSIQSRFEEFIKKVDNIEFTCADFRDINYNMDFVYADPPYSLSIGSYNDGKRGFKGWSLQDDIDLMNVLDSYRGKFALSNVLVHKGKTHEELLKWSEKYNVHDITCTYNNSNYQSKARDFETREVLITNY